MNQSSTQTLVLSFRTNKQNTVKVQINQPKTNLKGQDIKTAMQELISLAAITNPNEELILEIKGAGLSNRVVETISF